MFQTHIHLWLQQFDAPLLIDFFLMITHFGGKTFFLALLSALLFLVHLDKGFMILQAVLITILVTLGLKVSFNLPRPYHVHAAVQLWDDDLQALSLPYNDQSGEDFWALPQDAAIQYFRDAKLHTWGFPSGHTSMAMVFWGSLAFLFRRRWLQAICFSMILLVPLSRMYLGVHFLADIISGYVLGASLLLIFTRSLFRQKSQNSSLSPKRISPVWAIGIPFLPIAGFAYAEEQALGLFAFLLSAYVVHYWAVKKGIWRVDVSTKEKVARWLIAGALYVALALGFKAIEQAMQWDGNLIWKFCKNFVHLFIFFAGGLWLAHKISPSLQAKK